MALRFAWTDVALAPPCDAAPPVTNARTAHAAANARHESLRVIIFELLP
jgi:hypothetical protein